MIINIFSVNIFLPTPGTAGACAGYWGPTQYSSDPLDQKK